MLNGQVHWLAASRPKKYDTRGTLPQITAEIRVNPNLYLNNSKSYTLHLEYPPPSKYFILFRYSPLIERGGVDTGFR